MAAISHFGQSHIAPSGRQTGLPRRGGLVEDELKCRVFHIQVDHRRCLIRTHKLNTLSLHISLFLLRALLYLIGAMDSDSIEIRRVD